MVSIAILLPTYNEEQSIARMIDEIRALNSSWRIVVVDSGSPDRTVAIAREKGADVIEVPIRGKGIALKRAFELINEDYALQIDCDSSYPPYEIPHIIKKLEEGCDVVIGSRFRGKMEDGAMSFRNKFGNTFLSTLASILYLHRITDVCSGLWGFSKHAYKSMSITARHFEVECDMFADSKRKGFKVCEIPIDYKRREGTTKLSAIYGFIDAWQLLKKRI